MRPLGLTLLIVCVACGKSPEGSDTSDSSSGDETAGSSGSSDTAASSSPTTGEPASTGGSISGDASTGPGPGTTTATTDLSTSSGGDDTTTAAPACPPAAFEPGDHDLEIVHDGVKRTAFLHVPASAKLDEPTPLVFNFHGYLGNGKQEADFSGMTPKSDEAGFILVYPDGTGSSWNAGDCCGTAATDNVDDVGFVRALVAELQTKLCIDPRRIYATGMSNGGFMTHRLACEAADLFAAFAPVSAVNGMDDCQPSRPVPLLMFNGTADVLVIYTGGGNGGAFISAPKTFDDWAERDGCIGAAIPTKKNGGTSCKTHDICDADASVTLCTHEGMGHCWPGQPTCLFGTPNTELSANDEMWAFFEQNPLP
ncbi:MAG: prolyl oligopeptidase family serine peptidase [Nannocystis sp.]|uniref:extracellular catalytic domain type 1 short-chain-length polyhydroxyalkanoate depolymerase n=1 Tax=Nannocystis sp. TaxID=1962667 RepID=UPI0024269BAA|nr:PHB depolymerase family esterase [Nannocystis sp.]MBK9754682.1 prolyl oligopeptidase family serine peptidase [Nannocystis sp.]